MTNARSSPSHDLSDTSHRSPILALREIRKTYPGVIANDDVNLDIHRGEIHAVLGENGAGKSTLMKMIYGVEPPTSGEIIWEGKPVTIPNPATARAMGIGMVFQHFALFETLSVVENVAMALEAKDFNLAKLSKQIEEVSARYGLPIEPRRQVYSLSVGERQRVEIVRCLLQKPKLLIMDEPTSVLTPQSVETLFKTLRQLSDEGCAILYISHKLDEIKALCHSATVLRHGKVTGHADPRVTSTTELAEMMIGQSLPQVNREHHATDEPVLVVDNLNYHSDDPFETSLKSINLRVNKGQIVGIAGVSGNGQAELVRAISGEVIDHEQLEKTIQLFGQPAGHKNAAQRRKEGMVFVPEERLGRGAVPLLDLRQNALLTAHRRGLLSTGWIKWLKSSHIKSFTQQCIDDNDVRGGGQDAVARSLSGGNLQKYIMGRELAQQPKLVVVSQPTWGVDIGAASFIRQQLIDMAADGVAIFVVSEEIEELFEICDTLHVIANGHLSPPKAVAETDVKEIGLWMAGLWPDGPVQRNSTSAVSDTESMSEAS